METKNYIAWTNYLADKILFADLIAIIPIRSRGMCIETADVTLIGAF